MNNKFLIFVFSFLAFLPLYGQERFQLGPFASREKFATMSEEEHFQYGMAGFEAEDYPFAIRNLSVVAYCFPDSPHAAMAHYHLGCAYFSREELDYANTEFSNYLHKATHPEHFMEVIEYKFAIAEAFRYGARHRVFSSTIMPKWARDKDLAVEIYDEILAALPNNELTPNVLFSKGVVLAELHNFREAIGSFQTLIRRFPRNELAPESYRQIIKVYRNQAVYEFQNPDLIILAEIQLDKFREQFPRDEKVSEGEQDIFAIKESYAQGLYESGQFYERRRKPSASLLYYRQAVELFPETHSALQCQKRLDEVGYGGHAPLVRAARNAPFGPRPAGEWVG